MLFQILALLPHFLNAQEYCQNYTTDTCLFAFNDACQFSSCNSPPQNNTSFSQNWQTCVSLCCPYSNEPIQESQGSLEQMCSNFPLEEDELSAGGIAAMIIIILFAALCIYYFIVKKYGRYCPCVEVNHNSGGRVNGDGTELDATKRLRTSSFNDNDKNLLFRKEEVANQEDVLQNCSICLDGHTNIETECRHRFHMICLFAWRQRSRSCPDCRGTLGRLTIHCTRCYKSRIVPSQSLNRDGLSQCQNCFPQ